MISNLNLKTSTLYKLKDVFQFLFSIDKSIKLKSIYLIILNVVNSFLEFTSVILFYSLLTSLSNTKFESPLSRFGIEIFTSFLSSPRSVGPLILATIFVSSFLKLYTINFHNRLSAFIGSKIAARSAQVLTRMPIEQINSQEASLLLNLMSTDIPSVTAFYGSLFSSILSFFVLLPILLSLLLIEPISTSSLFIIILLLYVLSHYLTKEQQYKDGQMFTHFSKESLHSLKVLIDNIKVFKTSLNMQYELDLFEAKYSKARFAAASVTTRYSSPRYLIELFLYLLILLSINIIFVFKVSSVSIGISSFATLFFGLAKILGPSQILFAFTSQLNSISVVLDKIKSRVVLRTESSFLSASNLLPYKFESIKFFHVSHSYPDSNSKSLNDVNFHIKNSQNIGIAGASGSGKSTSINILSGLIKPSSGKVLVNDKDLYLEGPLLDRWKKSISYIPHHFSIPGNCLLDIFSFGNHPVVINKATLTRIHQCLSIAQYWDLPDITNDTLVLFHHRLLSKLPTDLSSGQLQRLNIARGLFKYSHIYIFDEFSSNLDSITEERILTSLYSLRKMSTKVFISHRISQLRFCDYVLIFNDGKIVEKGTYKYLSDNSNLFNEMRMNSQAQIS